ncbi:MAG TPA: T9SS type A sorting domain-containing protein [Bacteroidetes bacterium]|nr:T9SS type A sorting domain-containing protein [Bacteroidota bacterium]
MKNWPQIIFLLLLAMLSFAAAASSQNGYPDWAYEMKVRPFDILYPFETAFARMNGEDKTSDEQIRHRLNTAKNAGANVVIFYIDDEQSYETFVDEIGFAKTLSRIQVLVNEAHARNLKVIGYVNGLEVITVGAKNDPSMPSFARNFPNLLQVDITGRKMVWYTTSQIDWIPGSSEDAWASPLSPWLDIFKKRVKALSATGLDGIYVDAAFLPGVDSFGTKWASKDSYFEAEFQSGYGIPIPSRVDWSSEDWRKFVYFRHEVICDYLGGLADYARSLGVTPFFESSSCDYQSGTFLGNDVLFTIGGGIACSPEIEPEGDYLAAFRMSKATRDANPNFPMLFLGWPKDADQARREFSITLCHSGNYYPTADTAPPANSFAFLDLLREPVLNKRVPFRNTVLIYPMRSKDFTFETESTFDSYENAFLKLVQKHIPFRILPLETMTYIDLKYIKNVVLAGAESISDAEYDLLKNKMVSLVGDNGTKDEWGNKRSQPLGFDQVSDISNLTPDLAFTIKAPSTSCIEYYVDASNNDHYFIFAYNNHKSGKITISHATSLSAKVYQIDNGSQNVSGTTISIPIADYLEVIELQLRGTTAVNNLDSFEPTGINLENFPNPFNPSTSISYSVSERTHVKIAVFNSEGRLVSILVDSVRLPGNYEVKFDGSNLTGGIYFYKIITDKLIETGRMILVK